LFVSAAVIVGIGFSGLAVCLLVICCGVVCLYRLRLNPFMLYLSVLVYKQRLIIIKEINSVRVMSCPRDKTGSANLTESPL